MLPAVQGKRGEAQLTEFVRRWRHHKVMNKWMHRVFQYLVRDVSLPLGTGMCGGLLRTAHASFHALAGPVLH